MLYDVSFNRFLFAKPLFIDLFFNFFDIKKCLSVSMRLIASICFAWQRPTLAERKSATIGAKELTLL